MQLQSLESRRLLAGGPLGSTWVDTGEYLLGKVAVTTVLLESAGDGTNGDTQTQNWTSGEIEASIDKVTRGVNWWSDLLDTLDSKHELEFVFDNTFAETPFETIYEPIDRSTLHHHLYVSEFLVAQDTGERSLEEAMWRFNDNQRQRLDADWSFTVFIVDASDDEDGLFDQAPGGFPAAFAMPGGLYMVVPSGRSASTIAHELGHIFWAFDEYPGGASWHARRGYYDTQNLNATDDNPDLSTQVSSIMLGGVPLADAFNNLISAESTLAQVGWQDSDGDGIFDVLDVPLSLDGVGEFDAETSQYRFTGLASAVALPNVNSYGEHESITGTNADITLNRISEIQYSLDDGPWMMAAAPDEQVVDFDLTVEITEPFQNIRWRAIDHSTGITSDIVEGTSTLPAMPDSGHSGFAFVDQNNDQLRDGSEQPLANTTISVRHRDGSPLFGGVVDAADFNGPMPQLDGVTLTVDAPETIGIEYDPQLFSMHSDNAGGNAFYALEYEVNLNGQIVRDSFVDVWAAPKFVAEFDQPVGEVQIDAVALVDSTYARLEAFDAEGNLISRVTKEFPSEGDSVSLEISDSNASIARVRAFGISLARSGIAITRLQYGYSIETTTDQFGAWTLPNLPAGDYTAHLVPERVIHQFDQSTVDFQIGSAGSDLIVAAAQRVDSPRHNASDAYDVNQDESVSAADALVIINDLSRSSPRVLTPEETGGFDIDVNNDGAVSALDALLVINQLKRIAGEAESVTATDQVLAGWKDSPNGQVDTLQAPLVAPIRTPPMVSMLDSAGRAAPDESSARLSADTSPQPIGGDVATRKNPSVSRIAAPQAAQIAESNDEKRENADDSAQSLDLSGAIFRNLSGNRWSNR